MQIKSESAEVHYIVDPHVLVQKSDVKSLIEISNNSVKNRSRYCVHESVDSDLHEMFIAINKKTYLRPFKHINKSCSFHVISGIVKVILFTEEGEVADSFSLSSYDSGYPFYFRAPINIYRTLIAESDVVLYHEVVLGSFRKEETIYAPWAPIEEDHEAAEYYLNHLNN